MKRKAFTLIELLVVIAIIALLLAIIIPSLNLAKQKAASVVCRANTKNMSLAWFLYQEDNNSRIMSATMEAIDQNNTPVGWIGQPRNADGTLLTGPPGGDCARTSPVTDEHELRGIREGRLYSYLEATDLYHCPADKQRKGPDGTRLFVSYAIPRCLYGQTNPQSPAYGRQILRFSNITSPAMRFNFVESGERNRGNWIWGGYFIMAAPENKTVANSTGYDLWSPIAISHGDSGVFGFCDGHAESRRWRDTTTLDHYNRTEYAGAGGLYNNPDPPSEGSDIEYLARGWAYRHKR